MIKSEDKNKKKTIDAAGIIIYVVVAVIITTLIVVKFHSVYGSTIAALDDNGNGNIIWPPETATTTDSFTISSIQTLPSTVPSMQSFIINVSADSIVETDYDDNDQQLTITIDRSKS